MGTSLSGLTPATTFDGLLKTSDNDALDATLKTIGTGDGTDSILQLSNTAFQVNGEATIVGATNNTSASAIFAQNSDAYTLFQVRNDGTTLINNASYQFTQPRFISTKESIIYQGLAVGQTAAPSARLHIKGSGASAGTTSLLVQNSAGTDLFEIKDNGEILAGNSQFVSLGNIKQNLYKYLRSGNAFLYLSNTSGNMEFKSVGDYDFYASGSIISKLTSDGNLGIGETTPTARLHVKGSGNDNTTTSLLVQNSDALNLLDLNDQGDFNLYGTNEVQILNSSAVNRLFSVNPTNHATVEFQVRGDNENNLIRTNSSADAVGIGLSNASARLQVKGSGATSATTALLVQNSAGTELLKVNDDGNFYGQSLNVAGVLKMNNNQTIRFSGSEAIRGNISSGTLDLGEHSSFTNTRVFSQLSIRGTGNDATTTALLVQNSDGDDALKVGDDRKVTINLEAKIGSITHTSNRIVASSIRMQPYSGGLSVSADTSSAPSSTMTYIKGFGATSATTALLVKNSAGTDLLKVKDDGLIVCDSIQLADYIRSGQTFFRNNTIYNANASLGVLNMQSDSLSFSSTSAITNDASAMFQLESTTKGFLPPRMTTTERDAITTPAAGLMVYNTTTNKAQCYNGTAWQDLF